MVKKITKTITEIKENEVLFAKTNNNEIAILIRDDYKEGFYKWYIIDSKNNIPLCTHGNSYNITDINKDQDETRYFETIKDSVEFAINKKWTIVIKEFFDDLIKTLLYLDYYDIFPKKL